ncbi:hypothetical protein Glove_193g16 [Diversispora epigaea]|uniref:Uncharacterized protein n=1 Tax=Diversispora epigaea TaxID=1348612 RepID=A0A397IL96_9GLOM|nr:hypothetical protein Glove_193g16 [Diversispora epigaea]
MVIGVRNGHCTIEDTRQMARNKNGVLSYNGAVLKAMNGLLHFLKLKVMNHGVLNVLIENLKLLNILSKYRLGLQLDIPYYDYASTGSTQEKENQIVLKEVWYYEDPYIVIPEHLRELGLI